MFVRDVVVPENTVLFLGEDSPSVAVECTAYGDVVSSITWVAFTDADLSAMVSPLQTFSDRSVSKLNYQADYEDLVNCVVTYAADGTQIDSDGVMVVYIDGM